MLRKQERLSREAFNRFFSLGKRFHSPSLMLVYAPQEVLNASAVASKKIWKTAVERNKFRRRVYDAVRRMHQQRTLRGVYIFIAKPPARDASYEVLKGEVAELIHKTGRIG